MSPISVKVCLLLVAVARYCSPASADSQAGLLGMEFDDETGEELLKSLLPSDNNVITLPDTTIVLIGDNDNNNNNNGRNKIAHGSSSSKHSSSSSSSSSSYKEPIVIYQTGNSEADLSECRDKNEVCSKVDLYGDPWVERQCRCASGRTCSRSLRADDGHTIVDKTRQYKLCEPVNHLPICRYFKDITWTIAPGAGPNNATVQKMHCRCRPGSVSYLVREQFKGMSDGNPSYVYHFACSPQSRMRCEPKEPCRLFTVHKRPTSQVEEVNASPLCQCPKGHRCPRRHTDPGSLPSSYYGDSIGVKVYSGHCVPVHHEPVYTLVQ